MIQREPESLCSLDQNALSVISTLVQLLRDIREESGQLRDILGLPECPVPKRAFGNPSSHS